MQFNPKEKTNTESCGFTAMIQEKSNTVIK